MSNKTRLDVLLTERGLAESRQKAQAVIMAGHVFVAGQRVDKPGTAVLSDAPIEVRGHTLPYVSRGGLKLEKAMKTFPITLTDKICADIGASTGGFTDCMLQNGAPEGLFRGRGLRPAGLEAPQRPPGGVHGAHQRPVSDSGADPGSAGLCQHRRVLHLPEADLARRCTACCGRGARSPACIKPQFEAGREKVGKKGVVRDPAVHLEVLEHFLTHAKESRFTVLGITYSPIRGPEGNIEYLGYLKKCDEPAGSFDLPALVAESHSQLKD